MKLLLCLIVLTQSSVIFAAITIRDPSDYFDLSRDAADNAIKADYHVPPVMYLMSPLKATYIFNGSDSAAYDHQNFSASNNDTSVIVVGNGAALNLSFVDILKTGYSSNLLQASFFGVNAAINVQNGSRCFFDHLNITTRNGAANIYSYGNGSYVYIENSFLYSSGPAAHGLYAGKYGTIVGKNIAHYSGGNRCSAFAGDGPAGYVTVSDSIAHTDGIGSAIFYALGTINATNVVGYAQNSPALFSDGPQNSTLINCDLTAGLLGGTVMFSSMIRRSGATLNLIDSKLNTLGTTMPALWFGNIIATVYLHHTEINTKSGILVTANYSQVTQEFNYYAGYPDNPNLLPAIVTINVYECSLSGTLIAYNGSSISWILNQHSTWHGHAYSGYGESYISVSLDTTSTWFLTNNTALQNLTLVNNNWASIYSNGYNITYDPTSPANSWLNQTTIKLNGGGLLMPYTRGQPMTSVPPISSSSSSSSPSPSSSSSLSSSSAIQNRFFQLLLITVLLTLVFYNGMLTHENI